MKKNRLSLLSISLVLILFSSCKQQTAIKTKMDNKYTVCYMSIDKADTAWLKIDTSEKNILGEMKFNYANKNYYEGPIKAVIKGDTLRGNFSFRLNHVDKWYKNPIALLKKDDALIMGVGEVMTLWGSGYFDKNVPIDYDKGRFVFGKVGCVIR